MTVEDTETTLNTAETAYPAALNVKPAKEDATSMTANFVKATTTTTTESVPLDTSSRRAFTTSSETPVQYEMVPEVQYQIPLAASADGGASRSSTKNRYNIHRVR